MPELPEVESVRTQLQKYLVGHSIQSVQVRYARMFSGDKSRIAGKVKTVRRFGKVLALDLANGYSVVIHIKLTGQLIYRGPKLEHPPALSRKVIGGVPGKHTLMVWDLDKGGKLYYNDVRKFGWVQVVKTSEVPDIDFIKKLGPEPFNGLTLAKFTQILGGTKRTIKPLLMDQTKMGGIGNIYANDALWLAKLHPERKANELTPKEVRALFEAIKTVLKEGLKRGGASELAFVTPDGGEGQYQHHFLAYGKKNVPCPRCKKGKFVKKMVGGRGTNYCPVCQNL